MILYKVNWIRRETENNNTEIKETKGYLDLK